MFIICLTWSVAFVNLYCAIHAAPLVSSFNSQFTISNNEASTLPKVQNVGQSESTLPAVVVPPASSLSHGRNLLENGRQMEGNGVFLHMIIMAVAAIASAMVMMSESGTGNALSGRGPTGTGQNGGAVHIYMNSNGSKRRRKNTASTPRPQGRRNKLKVRKRKPINSKDTYPLAGTPGSATGPKAPKPQAPDPTTGFPRGKPKPLN